MVKEIKDSNFEELVEKNKGVCLVDCFAVWCVPCKMLSPVLEDLSNEMTEVSFFKVDVDQNPQLSNALEIQYMPTLIIYKDGQILDKLIGFTPKEQLKEKLQEAIR